MSYNAFRGTDSCGLFMNDELVKGIDGKADIRNFMAKTKIVYDPKCKNRLILAHSRKSTYGAHTAENAHPFFFEHEGRSIILAHNGTISNSLELAKKYEVDVNDLSVDSQRLAKIILERGYDVLNEYKGSAALMFTYSDEPGIMYVFKGASREKYVDVSPIEERPLFYISNNEGLYLSSMREPLDAASNQDLTVYTVPANKVCKIINNELFEVRKINRDDANVSFTTPTTGTGKKSTTSKNSGTTSDTQNTTTSKLAYQNFKIVANPFDIYNEKAYSITNAFASSLLFLAGRHYVIPREKFIELKIIETGFCPYFENSNEFLASGDLTICKSEYAQTQYNCNPFVYKTIKGENWSVTDYYYEGVLIRKDKVNRFKEKIEKRLNTMTNIFEKMKQLSAYAVHPITFTYEDAQKLTKDALKFYHGGNICKEGVFQSPYSFRRYTTFTDGVIKAIATKYDDDSILETVEVLQNNPYEDFDKINCFHDALTASSYYRYKGYKHDDELQLIMEETLNGAADVYYYSNDDENISILGTEIKKLAISMVVEEILESSGGVLPSDDFVENKTEYLYEEGMKDERGLETYMNNTFKFANFDKYILEAFVELEQMVFEEYYDSAAEDDSQTDIQQIGNESLS